ncbi:hypothetical protein ACTFIU_000977 [Dictyostelium citrinum]
MKYIFKLLTLCILIKLSISKHILCNIKAYSYQDNTACGCGEYLPSCNSIQDALNFVYLNYPNISVRNEEDISSIYFLEFIFDTGIYYASDGNYFEDYSNFKSVEFRAYGPSVVIDGTNFNKSFFTTKLDTYSTSITTGDIEFRNWNSVYDNPIININNASLYISYTKFYNISTPIVSLKTSVNGDGCLNWFANSLSIYYSKFESINMKNKNVTPIYSENSDIFISSSSFNRSSSESGSFIKSLVDRVCNIKLNYIKTEFNKITVNNVVLNDKDDGNENWHKIQPNGFISVSNSLLYLENCTFTNNYGTLIGYDGSQQQQPDEIDGGYRSNENIYSYASNSNFLNNTAIHLIILKKVEHYSNVYSSEFKSILIDNHNIKNFSSSSNMNEKGIESSIFFLLDTSLYLKDSRLNIKLDDRVFSSYNCYLNISNSTITSNRLLSGSTSQVTLININTPQKDKIDFSSCLICTFTISTDSKTSKFATSIYSDRLFKDSVFSHYFGIFIITVSVFSVVSVFIILLTIVYIKRRSLNNSRNGYIPLEIKNINNDDDTITINKNNNDINFENNQQK